jgi:hypothetical protein
MITVLIYLALAVIAVAGLAALARPRSISQDEYDEMKGKSSGVGNALQEIQSIFEPGRAEHLRKAKTEIRAEAEPGGDPPEPGKDDEI